MARTRRRVIEEDQAELSPEPEAEQASEEPPKTTLSDSPAPTGRSRRSTRNTNTGSQEDSLMAPPAEKKRATRGAGSKAGTKTRETGRKRKAEEVEKTETAEEPVSKTEDEEPKKKRVREGPVVRYINNDKGTFLVLPEDVTDVKAFLFPYM